MLVRQTPQYKEIVMKVYNKEKTELLENYDLNLGRLVQDKIVVNEPEIQGVEEQGHYEVIETYPNGGKDVKWVIDVKGVEYKPATTYEEDVLIYVPYTQEELETIKQQQYEDSIVSLIRRKYSLNQELAILRQRDAKPEEFAKYNAYVEQCKQEVKNNLTSNQETL